MKKIKNKIDKLIWNKIWAKMYDNAVPFSVDAVIHIKEPIYVQFSQNIQNPIQEVLMRTMR